MLCTRGLFGADSRDAGDHAPLTQSRHVAAPSQCVDRHDPAKREPVSSGQRRSNQRVGCGGGGAGFGKGEPAAAGAAAAALGDFGFFGRIGFRAGFGGGPAGLSSANTGLGSIMVEAGEPKSPGFRITWTGTVTGRNLGIAKVTAKPASGAGTATEQGVLQPGPSEVVASAPGGTDSS
jgi:hypothetical protein